MELKRDSMGFLGFHYYPKAKHFLLPVVADGTPSELIGGKNLIHRRLTMTTMPGFEKLFSAQLGEEGKRRVMGIFPYIDASGTYYFIICCPSKIYSYKVGDATPTDITGSVTLTGGETDYFDAVYFVDTTVTYVPWIVLTNGKDAMIKWDGTDNCETLGGSPPIAKYLDSFGGHITASHVISGGTTYGQRDQWSDVGEAEDWSGGISGLNDLRQDAGNISGSIVFGDIRFIFKETTIAIQRYTGYDPPLVYEEEVLPIGCIAPMTILKVWQQDYGFFLGRDRNTYLIRRDGMYQPIGHKITEKIREYSNDTVLKYSFAFYYPVLEYIFLALPVDDTNNFCEVMYGFDLGHYIRTGQEVWSTPININKSLSAASTSKFKASYAIADLADISTDGTIGGLTGKTIGDFILSTAFSQVIFGDKYGYIYKFDDSLFTYDGTVIDWEAEFKDLRLSDNWADNFRLQEYEMFFKNSPSQFATGNIYLSINGGNSFDSGQSVDIYNASINIYEETQDTAWFDTVARKFRLKISGTYPITLLGQRYFGTEEGRY